MSIAPICVGVRANLVLGPLLLLGLTAGCSSSRGPTPPASISPASLPNTIPPPGITRPAPAPPPGYDRRKAPSFATAPLYFANERLRIWLPDTPSEVEITSDLTANAYRIKPGQYEWFSPAATYEQEISERRRCKWWPWSRRSQFQLSSKPAAYRRRKQEESLSAKKLSYLADLGPFPRAGLHQVRLVEEDPAGSPIRTVEWSLWAFSGWPSPVLTATSQVAASRASTPQEGYTLMLARDTLLAALADARLPELNARWQQLLEKELDSYRRIGSYPYSSLPPPGCPACPADNQRATVTLDVALVLAPDFSNAPLTLLVLDDELACRDRCADDSSDLRELLWAVLSQALTTLTDTAFSNRKKADVSTSPPSLRPKPLVQPGNLEALKAQLRPWLGLTPGGQPSTSDQLTRVADEGFIKEELLRDGINELAVAPALRMRPVRRGFSQLEILFRLRLPAKQE